MKGHCTSVVDLQKKGARRLPGGIFAALIPTIPWQVAPQQSLPPFRRNLSVTYLVIIRFLPSLSGYVLQLLIVPVRLLRYLMKDGPEGSLCEAIR
jgi:hypothetical protein